MIYIQKEDFDPNEHIERVKQNASGCVLTFIGCVRDNSKGKSIERMSLEIYPEMAEKQLAMIREETLQKFDVQEIHVVHRYGDLNVGDNIILLTVASGHRAEAFKAVTHYMNELKKRVPIWKKEYTPDGEVWVEGEFHE